MFPFSFLSLYRCYHFGKSNSTIFIIITIGDIPMPNEGGYQQFCNWYIIFFFVLSYFIFPTYIPLFCDYFFLFPFKPNNKKNECTEWFQHILVRKCIFILYTCRIFSNFFECAHLFNDDIFNESIFYH